MTTSTIPTTPAGSHVAFDVPPDGELFAGQEHPPVRHVASMATAERPRQLRSQTTDYWLSLIGSALTALALVWVLFSRLLPFSGTLGFIVSWYAVFLLIYAMVSRQQYPNTTVRDRLTTVIVYGAAIVVIGTLALVVVGTVWQGRAALGHLNFFVSDSSMAGPLAPLTVGGVLHAVVGTLTEVAITIAITLPIGVITAVYLNEVGGRASRVVRIVVEAMTAMPDILAGLFIYIVLLVTLGFQVSGFAAAVALSITMLPITARAAEVVLRVVPNGLREASLALGASQWQTVWRVVLPTARPGLATALILGVARGIGETAPVLFTAGTATAMNLNPFGGAMASLPLYAFQHSQSPEPSEVARAFGAASVLLVLVVLLFVIARMAARHRGTRG